jgi:hypothetical protein
MKTRRMTLIWTYDALLHAVLNAFLYGDIAKVDPELYARPEWRKAVWCGVDAYVLRAGQPIEIASPNIPDYAYAATNAIWERMKDG